MIPEPVSPKPSRLGFGPRFALAIGNDDYEYAGRLKYAAKGARDVVARLESIGFQIVSPPTRGENAWVNLRRNNVFDAIERLRKEITKQPDCLALVYYAGHGVHYRGQFHLIPVDARLGSVTQLETQGIALSEVIHSRDEGHAHPTALVVILDACRSEPIWDPVVPRTEVVLKRPNSDSDLLVLYSAAPGQAANESDLNEQGKYTGVLLEHIEKSHDVVELHQIVTDTMVKTYGDTQTPWISQPPRYRYFLKPTANGSWRCDAGIRPDPDSAPPFENPYRGLESFDEENAKYFFGRDLQIRQLVERLNALLDGGTSRHRFIPVVGSSGSGKSSLVKAGLIHRLRRHRATPAVDLWNIVALTPGEDPLKALAYSLDDQAHTGSITQLEAFRTYDQEGQRKYWPELADQLETRQGPRGKSLIFVDQFEEFFTLAGSAEGGQKTETKAAEERMVFVENLKHAARPGGPAVVIVTMRAEYMDRVTEMEALRPLFDEPFLLGSMNGEDLRAVIEKPAGLVGLQFEEYLVKRMLRDMGVDDTANAPGEQQLALPLLEHCLFLLCEGAIAAKQGRARLQSYESMGGVAGALARHADQVYGRLTNDEQTVARKLLLSLVVPGDDRKVTGRSVIWRELPTDDASRAVRKALTDSRLITEKSVAETSLAGTPGATVAGRLPGTEWVLTLTHETLISAWDRFCEWIESQRDDLLIHRRIGAGASQWVKHGQEPGYLWRDEQLAEALDWRTRNESDLSAAETEFLNTAERLRNRLARRERRIRWGLSGLSLAALVLAGTASLFLREVSLQKDAADRRRDEALLVQSRFLADRSKEAVRSGVPTLGVLLALEGLPDGSADQARPYTEEPELRLYEALTRLRQRAFLPQGETATIGIAKFSPDDRTLVTVFGGNPLTLSWPPVATTRLWDVDTGHPAAFLEDTRPVPAAAESSAEALDLRRRAPAVLTRHIRDVDFSPDSSHLLTVLWDGSSAVIWDVASGAALVTLETQKERAINQAGYSPDGALVIAELAGAGYDSKHQYRLGETKPDELRVFDGVTGKDWAEANGNEGLLQVKFSPDGGRFVTVSKTGGPRLWDARARTLITTLQGHSGSVTGVEFSPDGTRILTASTDRTARVWDAMTGAERGVLNGHADTVTSAVFGPDGRTVLTTSVDATAKLWAIGEPAQLLRTLTGHRQTVQSGVFSASGRRVITRSLDRSARLWDVADGKLLRAFDPAPQDDKLWYTAVFNRAGTRVLSSCPSDSWGLLPSEPERARMWDSETGAELTQTATPDEKGRFLDRSAGFSEDGGLLINPIRADGGQSGAVKQLQLIDVSTGKPLGNLVDPAQNVNGAGFSRDGSKVLSSSMETASLWDASSETVLAGRFQERILGGYAYGADFIHYPDDSLSDFVSPSGQLKADHNDADTKTELVDQTTGGRVELRPNPYGELYFQGFDANGAKLLTSSPHDGGVHIWDTGTGRELVSWNSPDGGTFSAKFSPDGSRVVTQLNNAIRLWDANVGREMALLEAKGEFSTQGGFSPDGTRVVTYADSGSPADCCAVRIWDTRNGSLVAKIEGNTSRLKFAAFLNDANRIFTLSDDGTGRVWDLGTANPIVQFEGGLTGEVEALSLHRKSLRAVVKTQEAGNLHRFELWNLESGQRLAVRERPESHIRVRFTRDGAYFATESNIEKSLWDANSGELAALIRGNDSPDGSRSVKDSVNRAFIELRASDRHEAGVNGSAAPGANVEFLGHTEGIWSAQFSPDGKSVLTASNDKTARIFDAGTGATMRILQGHTAPVRSAEYSFDGKFVITASEDGSARIWAAETGMPRAVLEPRGGPVIHAAFSPDGTRAATLTADGVVRQWDVARAARVSATPLSAQVIKELGNLSTIGRVAVTNDGQRILAGDYGNTYLIHSHPSTRGLVEKAQRAVPRCLTPEERRDAYLDPAPPSWCIDMGKWPYHTLRWKAWLLARRNGNTPPFPTDQAVDAKAAAAAAEGNYAAALRSQKRYAKAFEQASNRDVGGEANLAALAYAHLARFALLAGDYDQADQATRFALDLRAERFGYIGKPEINAIMIRAHTLMFLGRAEDALWFHRKFKGTYLDAAGDIERNSKIPPGSPRKSTLWEDGVTQDFALLRKLGMSHPQMAEIEKELYPDGTPPAP